MSILTARNKSITCGEEIFLHGLGAGSSRADNTKLQADNRSMAPEVRGIQR